MITAIENLQSALAHAMSIRPKAGGFPVLAKYCTRPACTATSGSCPPPRAST